MMHVGLLEGEPPIRFIKVVMLVGLAMLVALWLYVFVLAP